SVKALDRAVRASSPVALVTQRSSETEEVNSVDELYGVGTLAKIAQVIRLQDGTIRAIVQGQKRIRLLDLLQVEPHLEARVEAIEKELGDDDPAVAEANELRERVEQSAMPDEVKEKALKEVDRLSRIPSASPEQGVIRTYVDWLVSLPWGELTEDNLDLSEAEKVLNEDHYGLEKPKERILEYMAVRKLAEKIRSPILLFVGPPGVGKTSLGRS